MYWYDNFLNFTVMAELKLELAKQTETIPASISYESNHICLKFRAHKSAIEISRIIGDVYMRGTLLKDFSLRSNNTSVCIEHSSIDSVKCQGNLFELQLNRIEYECENSHHADDCIIINLPPTQIEGLAKDSDSKTINALGTKLTFGYNDDATTRVECPKEIQKIAVSLISLFYCSPIEVLKEISNAPNGQTKVILRSQRRSFEIIGSLVNLHVKSNDVIEFIRKANINHPHFQDLPRYVRQFVDSFAVSEPQRFAMLFAMVSSFAESILGKGQQIGENLVVESVKYFRVRGLEIIEKLIKDANLKRKRKRKENGISNLAELRNECEHSLYSDASYEFFDKNPAVNAFMYNISCCIVMELAGISTASLFETKEDRPR